MQRQFPHLEHQMSLPHHYEAIASDTLRTIGRGKWLILSMVALTLAGAGALALSLDNKYTSESLVQLDFGRGEPARGAPAAQQGPNVTIDASALVETEARVIKSRAIAERVVRRLRLESDPAFSPSVPIVQRLLNLPPAYGGATLNAETFGSPTQSIAASLLRNLAVTSDQHSYLINVAYTSRSPKLSAEITNAFVAEYLRNRSEIAAKQQLTALSTAYGPRHPSVIQAQAKLDIEEDQSLAGNARVATPAEPIDAPSAPNRPLIIGLAAFCSFGLGILLVLLLERRDTGFRSEIEFDPAAGARCLGMLPAFGRAKSVREGIIRSEAARAIGAAAGLFAAPAQIKVALITSSVPREGKSLFALALAESLVAAGKTVLLIDGAPQGSALSTRSSQTLEEALGNADVLPPARDSDCNQVVSRLFRASGATSGQAIFRHPTFEKLLNRARESYDVILIETPPVLLFADVHDLRNFADTVLHVVRWNSTRRATVAAALRRMRDLQVRPDGIILSEVNQRRHRRYSLVDACSFYRDYGKYYAKYFNIRRAARPDARRAPSPDALRQQEGIAR